MRLATRMNESWHTNASHRWMSHGTHQWVMTHILTSFPSQLSSVGQVCPTTSHGTHKNTRCHTDECVVSHMLTTHHTQYASRQVTAHTRMQLVARMNESCHTNASDGWMIHGTEVHLLPNLHQLDTVCPTTSGTHTNAACHTDEWVMTQMLTSFPTFVGWTQCAPRRDLPPRQHEPNFVPRHAICLLSPMWVREIVCEREDSVCARLVVVCGYNGCAFGMRLQIGN